MREKKAAKKARKKKLAEKIAQDKEAKEAKQTMKIKGKNVADLTKRLTNILSASVSNGQTKDGLASFDVMA